MRRKAKFAPVQDPAPPGPPRRPSAPGADRPDTTPGGNPQSRWQRFKHFVWDKGGHRGGRR